MKTNASIPLPYAVNEYMLVIEPHEALGAEIKKIKQDFAERYDHPSALIGKPGITLARFSQYDMLETRILHRLQLIITAQSSFVVELHDFGSLPTHSIFLQVTTKTQIVELIRSLRPVQALLKLDKDHKPHFITDPVLNIARKLLPWQFEKGWLELSNTHFSGRFVADHLVLLRKREGETRFSMIKKLKMLNVREEVKQGQLF